MEFYVDEKQRIKRQRIFKLKIYSAFVVFLFLSIGGVYAVIYSPVFQLTQIDADLTRINADIKIIDDLKIFFIGQSKFAGFLGADNILIWNNKTELFLKDHPEIAVLSIEKKYFKRKIEIKIQTRERFGVWCQSECWWFDKQGIIFEKAPKAEGEAVYKINDFSGEPVILGRQPIAQNLFANLIKIFEVIEKAELNARTLYLENLSLQEIVIKSSESFIPKIYFSLRFDPSFGLAAIQSLKKTGFTKIEYIDFRVENRAYYKMK